MKLGARARRASVARQWLWLAVVALLTVEPGLPGIAAEAAKNLGDGFPRPLASYGTRAGVPLLEVLKERVQSDPINLVATVIFLLAIVHTFLAPLFLRLAHRFEHEHQRNLAQKGRAEEGGDSPREVSFRAEIFHLLGEVEAIFGIWVVPLLVAITIFKGWPAARNYLGHGLNFTEPMFVVVIMAIAASRPILKLSEQLMAVFAALGKGSSAAWWLSILTIGPVLGSLITEPAAMTISALLLAEKFYRRRPSAQFAYATLGLLFVNVSVGGTLTHFAAPPVLMVAGKWGWGLSHMVAQFGWKAVAGILVANGLYLVWFRREFKQMAAALPADRGEQEAAVAPSESVPVWITTVHILFLVWTVMNSHFPALFIGGFFFYLAFTRATEHHQSDLELRPPMLVGFFLAGLVVHGGLQGWWIAPVLSGLNEVPLFFGAALLTAFNDNAAITYLASLVPGFTETMKYAVVAGAVAAGGLTVIANAPNPAGQSILSRFFPDGVAPLKLFLGALLPTLVMAAVFLVFR